ncbi:MAG: hypothetical protein OEV95_05940 [Gemmatimonadota bacterium]|nr:hypothetical protein [Gemmatimonadota bacterium]MDH5283231.1 hypothetical protein [Gemmatimonadota bacterium]
MRYWRRHSGLRALLAVLVLIAQAACTSWRTQQVTPEELLREGRSNQSGSRSTTARGPSSTPQSCGMTALSD